MKRSKIFLGITTAVLAVAGVTAAKHYGPSKTRFYITSAGNYCKAVAATCTSGGTKICKYTASGTQFNLFTKGPEGSYPVSSNCTSQLKYANPE